MVEVRRAREDDEAALARIDRATWTVLVTPSPSPGSTRRFFGAHTAVGDVLVAQDGGAVLGYVKVEPASPLPASGHVQSITGLAVDPAAERRGAGRALVEAALALARTRGARRVTLRVLGGNVPALALYEACGFAVEGVLRGEFRLGGEDVDDVLMAYVLA